MDSGSRQATSHQPAYDPAALNATGRRRVAADGLRCFWYWDGPERYTAVSLDWGLTAHGPTVDGAKNELHDVLTTFIEVATERGMLVDILNKPDNRAARSEFRALRIAVGIVNAVLTIARRFEYVSRPPSAANEYRDRAGMLCTA
jgi:hypothetical protein